MHTVSACVLSCFSHVWLFVTLWIVMLQAPLSMGFFREEYWRRLPFPTSGIIPNRGSNLRLLHLLHWQASSLPSGNPKNIVYIEKREEVKIKALQPYIKWGGWDEKEPVKESEEKKTHVRAVLQKRNDDSVFRRSKWSPGANAALRLCKMWLRIGSNNVHMLRALVRAVWLEQRS